MINNEVNLLLPDMNRRSPSCWCYFLKYRRGTKTYNVSGNGRKSMLGKMEAISKFCTQKKTEHWFAYSGYVIYIDQLKLCCVSFRVLKINLSKAICRDGWRFTIIDVASNDDDDAAAAAVRLCMFPFLFLLLFCCLSCEFMGCGFRLFVAFRLVI